MESESHSHNPLRPMGAKPVAHPRDDEFAGGEHAHAPTAEEIAGWTGDRVTDETGHHVGKVEGVYDVEGRPEWLVVKHHRSHHLLAPVAGAIGGGGQVMLPFAADRIEAAPGVEPGAPASAELIEAARAYYGLG
ncbi:MAG: hypothetical protein U0R51_00495 [Solirubrobacterales bacterium]